MTSANPPNGFTAPNGENRSEIDEIQALKRLLEVASIVLSQAVDLVENSLTSDEQLSEPSKFIPGSTIGKHLRHARDHFALLVDCMSSKPPRVLNYDIRLRNTPMETSRQAAKEALEGIVAQLEKVVPSASLNETLTLHAVTPYPQIVQTTFGRELWFGSLHAIHHWSMIRVIAGELVSDLFAFAIVPRTKRYHRVLH
ncbi:unnamed protein product [Somion occarium]|uniref:DinB-like domain-containing protein n=1 Tax=Somion occarium TaxID=3059160 RepID=A0ABP1CQQ7_9APHY